jgi:formylglycine-generating enzyme required for sulfatase activity
MIKLALAVLALPLAAAFAQTPGAAFRDCADCPEMIALAPGQFLMGSTAEETVAEKEPEKYAKWEQPQHAVTIGQGFAVGKYEITRAEFAAFAAEANLPPNDGCFGFSFETQKWDKHAARTWANPGFAQTERHPVVCVAWPDAKAYAAWLSRKTGKPYRLLTEAEWEYATRAGTTTYRFWGNGRDAACRYGNVFDQDYAAATNNAEKPERFFRCSDGHRESSPVGSFAANPWGLHDTTANAWEWVEDCFHESYAGAPNDGSAWVAGECLQRGIRGGSWTSTPRNVRSAWRERDTPDFRYDNLGFRIARDLD